MVLQLLNPLFGFMSLPTRKKKPKQWNLVRMRFNRTLFESGEIFKTVKHFFKKCLVICFVVYSFISWNAICSSRPLKHHTHFASTHYFYKKNKNQSARKKNQKRIEKFTHKARNLNIAIGADTCKKAPFLIEKYIYIYILTRFPSVHLTIAVTVVTSVRCIGSIVINYHTTSHCGRWLETELGRLHRPQ